MYVKSIQTLFKAQETRDKLSDLWDSKWNIQEI